MRRFWSSGLALALVLACAPPASAEDAEQLVAQGLELRRARRDAEALAQFERAYAATPRAAILAQIGLARQATGDWLGAERDLLGSLNSQDRWIEQNRGPLQRALAVVQQHLASLDVRTNVAGAELWLNDERVGTLPASSRRMTIGTYRVSVRTADGRSVERKLELEPGDDRLLEIHFEQAAGATTASAPLAASPVTRPAASRAASPPVSRAPSNSASSNAAQTSGAPKLESLAIASGALAAVTLAEAVAASLMRAKYVDRYNSDACLPDRSVRCAPYRETADTFGTLAVIGYAVAGAAGLASVALFTEPLWNGASPRAGLSVSGRF